MSNTGNLAILIIGASGIRYAEGSVLCVAAGCPSGGVRGNIHWLLHGAGHAPQRQASG